VIELPTREVAHDKSRRFWEVAYVPQLCRIVEQDVSPEVAP
jgi:hypothetical protein